jgi:hypothetical protein
MNKRLEKRHKRQVARARERVKLSEPDVRTPEQIKAARELSRPDIGHHGPAALYARPSVQDQAGPAPDNPPKSDD